MLATEDTEIRPLGDRLTDTAAATAMTATRRTTTISERRLITGMVQAVSGVIPERSPRQIAAILSCVAGQLTSDERDLLAQLQEDGWPLLILAPPDPVELERVQELSLGLLRRGLIGVYRYPDDLLPREEAETILIDRDNWRNLGSRWFIAATVNEVEALDP